MSLLVILTYGKSLKDWDREGTLERELKYYYKLSHKNKINITFLSYGDNNDKLLLKNNKRIRVITLNKKFSNNFFKFIYPFFYIFKNLKIFKNFNFIKTNQNYGSWIAVFIKILIPNIKFISRGGYDLFHFKKLEGKLFDSIFSYIICYFNYKFADKIFVPTKFYYDFVATNFNINKNKIFIIPNYIDTDLFKNTNIKKYKDRFLFIGRLIEQKNLLNLIKIFANSNYKLDILGKGNLKKDISNYAKVLNSNIKFLNFINNEKIPNLLNKYNYFILYSNYEGNPKALLEAMSAGLLCFCNNSVGINNIIHDKKNGLLINNVNKIDTMQKFLNNKTLIKNLKKNARQYTVKYHSLDSVIEKESNAYKSY